MEVFRFDEKQDDIPTIVLVSHGRVAEALVQTAKLIAGENISNVIALCLEEGDNPSEYRKELISILEEGKEAKFVMADLYGGTPCNSTLLAAGTVKKNFEIVSGFNLPMFLEVLSGRESHDIGELLEIAEMAGKEGICKVKEMVL
ncbi:MAG: hypothetical protein KHZ58_16865 [Hungatella hathewayi]|nr:hypothetical protein [Hungatella hathewayi]